MSLSGSLKEAKLDAIISLLHSMGKSGILTFSWKDENGTPHSGTIAIFEGLPIQAETERFNGIPAIEEIATSNGDFTFTSQDVTVDKKTKPLNFEEVVELIQKTLDRWDKLKSVFPSMQTTLNYSTSDASSITLSPQEFSIISLLLKEPGITIQDLIHKASLPPLEVLQSLESLLEKRIIATGSPSAILTESQYVEILETVVSYAGAGAGKVVKNYFHIGMKEEEVTTNLPQFENEIATLVGKNLGKRLTEKIQSILSKK
uniref:DUF4388 domain-containing protein n=1 Tax=Caldisericum exile TaxID=693075 RepID=A0A7C4Y4D8_9BACT